MLQTLSALAEPNRLRIVELLRDGPRRVGDIGELLHLNQPQVSKHLRVLKEAHIVEVEPRAQERIYGLAAEPLRELSQWLEGYRQLWSERMDQLDTLVGELTEGPSRGASLRKKPKRRK
ncbi:MAG: winged helix-turn-helix transcriptional regulator [Planctomycetes bacterium]|nr:winged helix-turn-helix transcriptional regulator [Planctomycetota bacterium]